MYENDNYYDYYRLNEISHFSNVFKNLNEFNFHMNGTIFDNYVKAWSIINNPSYDSIVCSISGGSDSDIMLDIVYRCDKSNKVRYVWIDTGLEYQATKEHITFLERKYNITVEKLRGKPIPTTCRTFGIPFLNKQVSEYLYRLQSHNFKFENENFEELIKKYPNCKSALEWWCNKKESPRLNISWNKYLKEFLIDNPPGFKISSKCCVLAKENVVAKLIKKDNISLNLVGLRRAEGGVRAVRFSSCFSENTTKNATYRPIFWYRNEDKQDYEDGFDIVHSRCYSEDYGLVRTGCACCPFGRDFEKELNAAKKNEPLLYKAAQNIFGESYKYTRLYKEYVARKEHNGK